MKDVVKVRDSFDAPCITFADGTRVNYPLLDAEELDEATDAEARPEACTQVCVGGGFVTP